MKLEIWKKIQTLTERKLLSSVSDKANFSTKQSLLEIKSDTSNGKKLPTRIIKTKNIHLYTMLLSQNL